MERSRPLRVAMIGLRGIPASYGGVERAVEELSVRITARGHDVTVYGRTGYCDTSLREYQGVGLSYLPAIETKHLEAASHTVAALIHAIGRRRFDVIHLHATGPGMFSFIPRLTRLPTVVTIQGLDWRREKWGRGASAVLRLASRLSVTVPSETIVVSRTLQRWFMESMGARTTYIPNGVDAEGLRETAPVGDLKSGGYVLFVGRLVPEKGVHTLIRAFARVDGDRRLAIAGPPSHSGPYARELERLASRDPRVVMLGPRYGAEKAWLLRHARLFVQPSTVEGLPLTLLEAMACGAPLLVSDISENVEAITAPAGRAGAVFPTGDEDALAAALHRELGQTGHSDGDARSALMQEYDWGRIALETERVYNRAVEGARR